MKTRPDCPFAEHYEDLRTTFCKLYAHDTLDTAQCSPQPTKRKPFSCGRILDTRGEAWSPVRSGYGTRVIIQGDEYD